MCRKLWTEIKKRPSVSDSQDLPTLASNCQNRQEQAWWKATILCSFLLLGGIIKISL